MNTLAKQNYIINKCYKLLLKKGFDGVSVSDIQKECNVARGLLYHYFRSKEELFYEVVSKIIIPQLCIPIEETFNMNLRDTLKYICNRYYQMCINDELEGVSLLNFDFLIYRAIQESPEIKSQYEQIQRQEQKVVKIAIEQSIANGEMVSDIDTNELAILTTSLIDGVWLNSLNQGEVSVLFKQLENIISLHLRLLNHK